MTYTYSICEGFAVGTELGTITATDCDIGNNGMIHYTIESTEGLGLFTIDEVTGVFSIAAPIDYEQTGSSIVVEVRYKLTNILYYDVLPIHVGCW